MVTIENPKPPPSLIINVPTHVAIIMDGNGRWAQQQGLPRLAGHRAGTNNIRRVIEAFAEHGVSYLTVYAFSTENWIRPPEEVRGLMRLLEEAVRREREELHRAGVRLIHLGSLMGIAPRLRKALQQAVELTEKNSRMTLAVAFNYGGRAEILEAVRRIVADGVPVEEIDEEHFSRYLYSAGLPDPDLVIRTGGEMRLSNFLVWQTAYSEYYSTPTLWPDFGPEEVYKALLAYSRRERRFGGVQASKNAAQANSRTL